ncbi:MAG TPA: hypothetical protein VN578_05825 [Candidatus Binatia bacterium]|jgi:hypothetical protein|nr:hypothetical protein [Candidatus Binatia bacterium]
MICKRPENRVRATILSHRAVNVLVEPRNRAPDRVRRAPRAVARAAAMLALELGDLFEFAQRFGFFEFGGASESRIASSSFSFRYSPAWPARRPERDCAPVFSHGHGSGIGGGGLDPIGERGGFTNVDGEMIRHEFVLAEPRPARVVN